MQSRTHASARPLVLGVVVVLGFLMVLPASNMFSRRKPNLALYVPATVYDAEHPEFFRDELRKYPTVSTSIDGRRICEIDPIFVATCIAGPWLYVQVVRVVK
jgi:hypothetical protein